MRKFSFSHLGLPLALAALLAVAAPGAPLAQAAARPSDLALLTDQLPTGETLTTASWKDLDAAVTVAVAKRPSEAKEIVRIAIMAKKPKHVDLACEYVMHVVRAAMKGAPDQSQAIMEMAQSLAPGCSDALQQFFNTSLNGPSNRTSAAVAPGATTSAETTGTAAGVTTGLDGSDFGAGFGAGFPGSPGFSGSSPSGTFALPSTAATPVTSAVNG